MTGPIIPAKALISAQAAFAANYTQPVSDKPLAAALAAAYPPLAAQALREAAEHLHRQRDPDDVLCDCGNEFDLFGRCREARRLRDRADELARRAGDPEVPG